MNKVILTNTITTRLAWVDWAKSIGIFLVVLGHMRVLHGKPFIYMFHMAFFFMISGYLYKPVGFSKELLKSTKALLVPYVFFNAILLGVAYLVGDFSVDMLWKILVCDYEQFPIRYFSPMWFLISLFIMRMICSVVNERWYAVLAACCCLFSCILFYTHNLPLDKEADYFQWSTTCICLPPFVIGFFMRTRKWLIWPDRFQSKKEKNGIMLSLLATLLIIGRLNGRVNVFTCAVGHDIIVYFIVSTLISAIYLYYISHLMFMGNNVLVVFSTGTIVVLTLHVAMIDGLSYGIQMNSVYSIILSFAIMAICYPLIIITGKYLPFIIGKKI